MKYVKLRKDFAFILNPLLVISGIFFFWCFSAYVISSFYAFLFAVIAIVIAIFSPWGNRYLAHDIAQREERLPVVLWLTRIFLLELSMLGTYWGICLVSGITLPIYTQTHLHLLHHTLQLQLLHWGLFPWALYAFVAASMGVLAFRQHSNAYLSNLIKPFTKDDPQESFGLISNIGARRSSLFAFSITLLFAGLLILTTILPPQHHIAYGFNTSALLTTLFLLALTMAQFVKTHTKRIFSRHIATRWSLPIFSAALAAAILSLSVISMGLVQHAAPQSVIIPDIIQQWIQHNWHTSWLIFSTIWWICFAPLVSSYFACLSKGYRIRDMLLGVLALPILITIILLLHQHFHFQWPHFSPLTEKFITLIALFIFLPLLLNHHTSGNAIVAYCPKDGISKPRDHAPYFQKLVQLTIIHCNFFLIIGINGLAFFAFALNYLLIVPLLLTLFTGFFL